MEAKKVNQKKSEQEESAKPSEDQAIEKQVIESIESDDSETDFPTSLNEELEEKLKKNPDFGIGCGG